MNKIEARILYEEVRDQQDGLYVWVDPAEGSVLRIQGLLKGAPFKAVNTTDYHCTVLHCSNPDLPQSVILPDDQWFEGRMSQVVTWQDHKDRTICVLLLDVPELEETHARLTEQGLQHGHHEYNPHITLSKGAVQGPELRLWLDEVNAKLRQVAHRIVLGPRLMASTCA